MNGNKTLTIIIGNGYLSGFLVPLTKTSDIVAIRRGTSAKRYDNVPASIQQVECNVLSDAAVKDLVSLVRGRICEIYWLLPPSAFSRRSPKLALKPLFEVLSQTRLKGVVIASSTAVYGELERRVSRTSSVDESTDRASFLLDIEDAWRTFFASTQIVRLAGLYGPGRIVGKSSIEANNAISGSGFAWLNLVRIEDAARALQASMMQKKRKQTYLISDGNPMARIDYYQYLSNLINGTGCTRPVFERVGPGGKKCDSQSSWYALNLRPLFPNYKQGLDDLFRDNDRKMLK